MPDNILRKRLARWRSAYRNSGLRRFLDWWGQELAALLPERVRSALVERRDELRIEAVAEGGWTIQRMPGDREADRIILPVDAAQEDWQSAVTRLRARSEVPADLVLVLAGRGVLERHLSLPLAAEDNLAQVLAFEMDRQTPFKPEQVRFDHRIARRDVAARQISIDLLIAPRVAVDAALAPVQSAGLALDAVDTLAVDGRRNGYNLLPQEARGERSQRDRFLNWIFAAAVIVLAWTAMSTSIRNREKALEDLHAEVDRVKVEARRVGALEKELADAVSGANFLTEMKQTHPVAIDLVRDLTERLPENTALQRLSVNRGEVQIQGVSGEASALITILQKSLLIEGPALQGAITPDQRTQKEQFMIQARTRVKSVEGVDAVPAQG
ncbi:MAG: PilN domain-containing protein [Rhodanobacteraceae bacterium]|nr:PilN domain-containing protein [Rhodanobacteraceae bacterium]MBK7044576.1 PilN domain-containing protein [Rhodanobacteraceae bacterium]MBP9154003.1 PilN domain-containing protein [Xanthomonadales bacterium]HQW82106.1 PilN domain-containing protein [Pseudomonadota bacterium]